MASDEADDKGRWTRPTDGSDKADDQGADKSDDKGGSDKSDDKVAAPTRPTTRVRQVRRQGGLRSSDAGAASDKSDDTGGSDKSDDKGGSGDSGGSTPTETPTKGSGQGGKGKGNNGK
ncbi:MAG: hypothetical protein U5J98_12135 [Halobacteriales archaeon]|nr:hypothetical protein [Halobacteriales archaeon]